MQAGTGSHARRCYHSCAVVPLPGRDRHNNRSQTAGGRHVPNWVLATAAADVKPSQTEPADSADVPPRWHMHPRTAAPPSPQRVRNAACVVFPKQCIRNSCLEAPVPSCVSVCVCADEMFSTGCMVARPLHVGTFHYSLSVAVAPRPGLHRVAFYRGDTRQGSRCQVPHTMYVARQRMAEGLQAAQHFGRLLATEMASILGSVGVSRPMSNLLRDAGTCFAWGRLAVSMPCAGDVQAFSRVCDSLRRGCQHLWCGYADAANRSDHVA